MLNHLTGPMSRVFLIPENHQLIHIPLPRQNSPLEIFLLCVQDLATHGRVYRIKKDDDSDIRTDDLDYDNFRIAPVLYVPVLSITITTFRRLHQHFQPTSLHWIGIEIPDYLTLVTLSRLSVGYDDRVQVVLFHFSVLYHFLFFCSSDFGFIHIPITVFFFFFFVSFVLLFSTGIFFPVARTPPYERGGTWSIGLRPPLHRHMTSRDIH